LVEALENYIKELDEGKTPSANLGTQERKNLEKVRSHMDKFDLIETDQQEDSDSDDEASGSDRGNGTIGRNSSNRFVSSTPNSSNARGPSPSQQPSFQPENQQRTQQGQSQGQQPTFQPQSPQSQNLLFDPFDLPTSGNTSASSVSPSSSRTQAAPLFDPFGSNPGDDFFSSGPSGHALTPLSSSSSTGSSTHTFDPFATTFSTQSSGPMNQVAYDDKKKNVELFFGQQPITPVQVQPTPTSPVLGLNSQFGSSNTFNPNPNPAFAPSFDPFGPTGNGAPSFQPPMNQQQPNNSFKPVTNSNSNPFLTDPSNPFG